MRILIFSVVQFFFSCVPLNCLIYWVCLFHFQVFLFHYDNLLLLYFLYNLLILVIMHLVSFLTLRVDVDVLNISCLACQMG